MKLGSKCEVVQRARLPRGRTGRTKKTALEERVARLENLMKQVGFCFMLCQDLGLKNIIGSNLGESITKP
jgi:hypothetical protein